MYPSMPQTLKFLLHIYLSLKLCDATNTGEYLMFKNTLGINSDIQQGIIPHCVKQGDVCTVVDHSLTENASNNDRVGQIINDNVNRPILTMAIKYAQNDSSTQKTKCDAIDLNVLSQKLPQTPISTVKENFDEKIYFFVVTAIFNPASYKSRYNLYHNFAKHMNDTGAQLITIECIFPSLNQTEFQITENNNPWHIQLKSESIYWMKENLINIAVSRLPPHAKWISWLDADIDFEDSKWVQQTIRQLKNYTVIQIFEKAKFLGPSPKNEILRTDYSFGYSVVHNKPIDPKNLYAEWYPHRGYGWAMGVKDFKKINGLPDYTIVGAGDRFFAYSLINRIEDTFTHYESELNPIFRQMLLDNSNETYHKLKHLSQSNRKNIVGYVPVTIRHNWHGSKQYRQYTDRWMILRDNDYNFFTDIRKNEDGLFHLNPNKPQLQRDILAYFQTRQEDTIDTNTKDRKAS